MNSLATSLISFLLLSAAMLVSASPLRNTPDEIRCRPFTYSVSLFDYNMGFSRSCSESDEKVLSLSVSYLGRVVSVDSATLISPKVNVADAIVRRLTQGFGKEETDRIVKEIGPALAANDLPTAKKILSEIILTN